MKRRIILRLNINDKLLFSSTDPDFIDVPKQPQKILGGNDYFEKYANVNQEQINELEESTNVLYIEDKINLSSNENLSGTITTKVYDIKKENVQRCWYCTLDFDEDVTKEKIGCPVRYKEDTSKYYNVKKTRRVQPKIREEEFECEGYFCSWSCSLSYMRQKYGTGKFWIFSFMFNRYLKKYFPSLASSRSANLYLKTAPPRESLTYYGGKMDEKEYRSLLVNDTHLKKIEADNLDETDNDIHVTSVTVELTKFPLVHAVQQIAISTKHKKKKQNEELACSVLDKQMVEAAKNRIKKASGDKKQACSRTYENNIVTTPSIEEELFITIEEWRV